MKRYDIKNDPRFKDRVKALSSDKRIMVLKKSLPVKWNGSHKDAYIKAIAPNGNYFVAMPLQNDDGSGTFGPTHFLAHWMQVGSTVHEAIKTAVLSWLVLADEDEVYKVKDIAMIPLAIEAIVEHKGVTYFEWQGPTLTAEIQGALNQKIPNPYHKEP